MPIIFLSIISTMVGFVVSKILKIHSVINELIHSSMTIIFIREKNSKLKKKWFENH